jgi:predicted Zn-dependent protease
MFVNATTIKARAGGGWTAVLLLASLTLQGAETSPQRLAELEQTLQPMLASADDVAVRRASTLWKELLDGRLAAGQAPEAGPYLKRYLQAVPRAFSYQLAYGELLAKQGQPTELPWRAAQTAELSEEDDTIRKARKLLGKVPPAPFPALVAAGTEPELVLVPIGEVSDFWMTDLREALKRRVRVPVTICRFDYTLPPATRDGAQQWAAAERRRWLEKWDTNDEQIRALKWFHVKKPALEAGKVDVIETTRRILQRNNPGLLNDFNAHLDMLSGKATQWEGSKLLADLVGRVAPLAGERRVILFVTTADLYTETTNFVFGIAAVGRNVGLVSSARFAAAFNNEVQDRPRLVTRLTKQAVVSYTTAMGVERCTNPACARAVAMTLAELDTKPAELCAACRVALAAKAGIPPGN